MIVCAAGNDNASIMHSLIQGEVSLSKSYDIIMGDKDFNLGIIKNLTPLPSHTPKHFNSRTNTILYNALLNGNNLIKEILAHLNTVSIIIGTTTTGIEENYKAIPKKQYLQDFSSLDNPALFVRHLYGICALSFGVCSACTSGVKAIIEGARLIKSNLSEAVICGGVDSLNTLTINGFDSLEILSPNPAKAFCEDREGINIGEGAGVFVLISDEALDKIPHLRDEFKLVLKGYASNNDAFHITKPRTDFASQEQLLKNALESARLKPQDIDYINLHGTGTPANDEMEAKTFAYALNGAFKTCPASSIKPLIGHTLGAAGAIEAGVCAELIWQSLQTNGLKSNLQNSSPKDSSPQSYLIPHIYDYDKNLPHITLAKKGDKAKVCNALSVSFAFGGDNSAIILSKSTN